MLKNKFLIVSAVVFSLTVSSCSDSILDKEPITELVAETAFETEADIQKALNAAYDPLQWQFVNGFHTFPQVFQSIRADDHHSQQAAFWAPGLNFDQFSTILPSNQNVSAVWSKWYQGVSRANFTIKLANDFEGFSSQQVKDYIIGEAKFLRGIYYFELVRLFGGVPLMTEAITSTEDQLFYPRSTAAEVYAQIEADLLEASSLLPQKGARELWRADSGAALGFLAKVHLYQGEYPETVQYCEKIVNEHNYALEANFSDNFELTNEFGVESLFEINYVDGLVAGGFESSAQQEGSGSWQFMFMWVAGKFTSWGNMIPRQTLVGIYDDADQRKQGTFILPGSNLGSPWLASRGWDPAPDNFGFAVGSNAMNRKFFLTYEEIDPLLSVQQSPKNEKMLRYSDILLMHAEASIMGGGGNGQASLDAVTNRAFGGTVPYTLENIKIERRKELATEGWNRFTDLVRWGDIGAAMNAVGKSFTPGRDELLPIPQLEIDLSDGLLTQNPGY